MNEQLNAQARQAALVEKMEVQHPEVAEALDALQLSEAAYAEALAGLVEPPTVVSGDTCGLPS